MSTSLHPGIRRSSCFLGLRGPSVIPEPCEARREFSVYISLSPYVYLPAPDRTRPTNQPSNKSPETRQAHLFLAAHKYRSEHSAASVVSVTPPPVGMGFTQPPAVWAPACPALPSADSDSFPAASPSSCSFILQKGAQRVPSRGFRNGSHACCAHTTSGLPQHLRRRPSRTYTLDLASNMSGSWASCRTRGTGHLVGLFV